MNPFYCTRAEQAYRLCHRYGQYTCYDDDDDDDDNNNNYYYNHICNYNYNYYNYNYAYNYVLDQFRPGRELFSAKQQNAGLQDAGYLYRLHLSSGWC